MNLFVVKSEADCVLCVLAKPPSTAAAGSGIHCIAYFISGLKYGVTGREVPLCAYHVPVFKDAARLTGNDWTDSLARGDSN